MQGQEVEETTTGGESCKLPGEGERCPQCQQLMTPGHAKCSICGFCAGCGQ